MSIVIHISDKLFKDAKISAKINNRSNTEQIEYWAKIGKIVEDNPNLPYSLKKEILIGMEELDSGECTEYEFCH